MGPRAVRALSLFPVVLLVVVAGWQAVRIETHNQSAWIGAGFSMFSFVDNAVHRPLVVTTTGDPAVPLDIPPDLEREAERLTAAPTVDRVTRFAEEMAQRQGEPVTVARGPIAWICW